MCWAFAQETNNTRCTAEATCWIGMGCWSKNSSHSDPVLDLLYSTAEYCAPVWCRSAHTRFIDSVLNDALRIVNGCLRPTPADYLPVLGGIQPAELRRQGTTLSLAYRGSLDSNHILNELLAGPPNAQRERLKSRRPFVPASEHHELS